MDAPTNRTPYHQEPYYRPPPEFEPISATAKTRKAFNYRRGPRGATLYAAYFGALVVGHYVFATGSWVQRELVQEQNNLEESVNAYLYAEADRKYLQSRRGKESCNEESQYKTRWVRPATNPFRQWDYVRRQFEKKHDE